MAQYRAIFVNIWREDEWFLDLDTDGKLLWFYLLTNPSTAQAGIYKLPLRTMVNESGLTAERVGQLIAQFTQAGKIMYADGVIWIRRMRAYQTGEVNGRRMSATQITGIENDLREVPDGNVKRAYLTHYGYPLPDAPLPHVNPTDTLATGYADPVATPATPPAQQETEMETHVGADAPTDPAPPLATHAATDCRTLELCLGYLQQRLAGPGERGFNPPGALGALFTARFGSTFPPDFGRLGRLAGQLSGGHIALAKLIWNAPQTEGDPHDYLQGAIRRAPNRSRTLADAEPARQPPADPQLAEIRRLRAQQSNGTNGAHAHGG